jgi:hypothetical protein
VWSCSDECYAIEEFIGKIRQAADDLGGADHWVELQVGYEAGEAYLHVTREETAEERAKRLSGYEAMKAEHIRSKEQSERDMLAMLKAKYGDAP